MDPVDLRPRGRSVRHATARGLLVAALLLAAIYLGSRRLRDFDAALAAYAAASVFAAFGLAYRYAMWLRRPPTRLYWVRGWQTFLAPRDLLPNLARVVALVWENLVAQRFIERRSRLRWTAHMLIAWGCILAAAITFPLSFGWVRFESAPHDPTRYDAFVMGVRAFRFPIESLFALLVFNALDVAAVMVLAGIGLSLWRRGRDRGAEAVQQFDNDLWPLLLLFAVSITGIFLTVSTHAFRGIRYGFLSELHAVTVIFTLLYLPFGKFFHVFQRPAQVSIKFYRNAGERSGQARCARCGAPFASALHVADLKTVQAALGIRYEQGGVHYQDVCPACRRAMLATAQGAIWRAAGRTRHEGD